jgi:hypothetical protein
MRDHLLTVSQPHDPPTQDFPKNLCPPSSNTPKVLTSVHPMPVGDHSQIGRNVLGRPERNRRILVKLLSTLEKFWHLAEHWQGNTKLDDK